MAVQIKLLLFLCLLLLFSAASAAFADEVCHPTKTIDPAQANKPLPAVEIIKTLTLDHYVTGIAWSPDGRLLATSESMDMVVKIWDTRDYHVFHTITKENKGSERLVFTADGNYLVTSSQKGYDGVNRTVLSIIDVANGNVVKNVDGPRDPKDFPRANAAEDFVLSPDGKFLYVGFFAGGGIAYIYDANTWENVGTFPFLGQKIENGPQDNQLTFLDAFGHVKTWSLSKKGFVQDFVVLDQLDMPSHAAVNAARCQVASGIGMRSRKCVENCDGRAGVPLVFKSSGDLYPIRIWDANTGKQQDAILRDESYTVAGLTFSPDGNLLIAEEYSGDYSVKMRNAANLSMEKTLYKFRREFWKESFSSNGKYLAVAGDNKVVIFKIE